MPRSRLHGIVRGTRKKQEQRLYRIKQLQKAGKLTQAAKLQAVYDKQKVTKPNLESVNPELDSRFIKIDFDNPTSFDGWITISSTGMDKIIIPVKRTKHFNQLLDQGQLLGGIRLGINNITFMIEINDPEPSLGEVLGIDIGLNSAVSCSNGHQSTKNNDGYDLKEITKILSRKKKGSKGFRKAQAHRTNYINWSINQLDLSNISQVNIEDIKQLRNNKRTNRKLGHWTYTTIFGKIEAKCEQLGVQIVRVNPTYTSQRCSSCGWTCKSNRRGLVFKCVACGEAAESDLNAAKNIALPLTPIKFGSKQQRSLDNKGFYWLVNGSESIVPVVLKTEDFS